MYNTNINLTGKHVLRVQSGEVSYEGEQIRRFSHKSAVCGESISFGNICPACIELEIGEKVNLLDRNVAVTAEFEDGTAPLGVFRVTECSVENGWTKITAYDSLYWATGGDYVPTVGENPTVSDVLADIAQQIGVGIERKSVQNLDDNPTVWGYGYAENLATIGTNSSDSYIQKETLEENGVKFRRVTVRRNLAVEPNLLLYPPRLDREYPSGYQRTPVFISAKIRFNTDGPSADAGEAYVTGRVTAGDPLENRTAGEWRICHVAYSAYGTSGNYYYGLALGKKTIGQTESGSPLYMKKGDSIDVQWMVVTFGDDADFVDLENDVPSPAVTGNLTGYTIREMLAYMGGLIGKNATLSRENRLKMRWFGDEHTVTDYYMDGLKVSGDYLMTGITARVPQEHGEELRLSAGEGTGMAVEISNPFMTQERLDEVWNNVGGLSGQLGAVSLPFGFENEAGDIITVTDTEGKTSRLLVTSVELNLDGGCKCDMTAAGQSASEAAALFQGALGQSVLKLEAAILEVRELIAQTADIGKLTVDVARIRGSIESTNYEKKPIPLVYPSSGLFPSDSIHPSDGSEVVRGFKIDFTSGVIEGAFTDSRVQALEERVQHLEELLNAPTILEVNENEL